MGSHFLHQGDLPNPGIEPGSPALPANALPSELPGTWLRRGRKSTIQPKPLTERQLLFALRIKPETPCVQAAPSPAPLPGGALLAWSSAHWLSAHCCRVSVHISVQFRPSRVIWNPSFWFSFIALLTVCTDVFICMSILCHLQGEIPFISQLSTHTVEVKINAWGEKRLFLLRSGHPDISYFVYFFFLIVKYTQHKICHFKHFEVHSLVALSTFNLLENHHHQPSPELCHYPKWKLCFH